MAQSPPAADEFSQQYMQHDTGRHYMHDSYATDQHGYIHSGTNSGYITPDPNHVPDHHGLPYMGSYGNQYKISSGMSTDPYGHPIFLSQQGQEYYAAPANQYPSPVPFQFTSSPPTPSASDLSSSGKRKRPNRSHAATSSASPGPSAPRAKKAKQAKGEKAKTPRLDAPLSVLTKDSNVKVKDMGEWVNRPTEVRLAEVEKRAKNKITRPMNSFMLYRSAYADRTKAWCSQNNHQVVSSVSGDSWPMEPKEIRELYTEYARIERDNHQKAHPGYKFSPTKPGTAGRKRKDASEDEGEESDLETMDGEYMPTSRNRSRRPQQATPDSGYSGGYSNQYGYQTRAGPGNPSSYQYNNPNKPMPVSMADNGHYGRYYQTAVQPRDAHTEDVLFQRTQMPNGMSYGTAQGLSSVPGGDHHELLNDSYAGSSALELNNFEASLDPSLTDDYGMANSAFAAQQSSGQSQELAGFQSYSYPGTESHDPVAGEWSAFSDDPAYTKEDVEKFLQEANGKVAHGEE